MPTIEVDLNDYKDEIRYAFCRNNNCLLQEARTDFAEKFDDYVTALTKKLFFYNEKVTVEQVLQDLIDFNSSLKAR